MKHLHLDCFAGISGDMMTGALLDLGWPESAMRSALARVDFQDEFHVHVKRVHRGLIDCVKFDLHSHHEHQHSHEHQHEHHHSHEHQHEHHHSHEHQHEHHHSHEHQHEHHHSHEHQHEHRDEGHRHGRTFRQIQELIGRSELAEPVKLRVLAVFERIAVAEGKIHGQPPEDVGFHEVGAVDSIGDIVAACSGLHELGIQSVSASAPVEGSGWIRCAHGNFPLPAPATLEILRGIPVRQIDEPGERITPTGAALLAEFARDFGPQPEMQIDTIGYGAGTRDPQTHPNLLRAVLGIETGKKNAKPDSTPSAVVEIRCNLDDCTPEILGSATEALFAAGALDVNVIPCQMKKNRSGFLLTVLATEDGREDLCRMILRHTTAFGVRWHRCERLVLERTSQTVETPYGPVEIKIGRLDGEILQVAPEHASCAEVAARSGIPLRDVYREAERLSATLGR